MSFIQTTKLEMNFKQERVYNITCLQGETTIKSALGTIIAMQLQG